jgi:hypothetical protein
MTTETAPSVFAWTNNQAMFLARIMDRLDAIEGKLDGLATHIDKVDRLLTEFEPVIRAYLDPAASGPVAWAVRRQIGKGAKT